MEPNTVLSTPPEPALSRPRVPLEGIPQPGPQSPTSPGRNQRPPAPTSMPRGGAPAPPAPPPPPNRPRTQSPASATPPPDGPTEVSQGDDDRPGDPGRTGAVWVTATGVFCILAAAAVFLAVRWDTLADHAKFGVLAALTASAVLAGRGLRRQLPATGGVLFHLGVLLVPLDIIAATQPLDWHWGTTTAVVGSLSALGWWAVARSDDSPVLRWSAGASTIVAVGGVAAMSGLPAPAMLAGFALTATVAGAQRCAIGWALVAGVAPLLGGLQAAVEPAVDVLEVLGLGQGVSGPTRAFTGIVAAVALGLVAHRRRDLVLVGAAAAVASIGLIGLGADLAPQPDAAGVLVAIAVALLVAEVVAHLVRRDDFWSIPATKTAITAEMASGLALLVVAQATGWMWLASQFDAAYVSDIASGLGTPDLLVVAAALNAFGWFVADLRRRHHDVASAPMALAVGAGWLPATWAITVSLVAGVGLFAPVTTAVIVLVALTVVLVLSGRDGAQVCAVLTAVAAVSVPGVVHVGGGLLMATAGVSCSLALASAAVLRSRTGTPSATSGTWLLGTAASAVVGVAVLAPALHATFDLSGNADTSLVVLALGLTFVLWWVVASVLDACDPGETDHIGGTAELEEPIGPGALPRTTVAIATYLSVLLFDPLSALWLAGTALLLVLIDLARGDRTLAPAGLTLLVPLAGGLAAPAMGYPTRYAAVGLVLSALVAAGMGSLVAERWRESTNTMQWLAAPAALLFAAGDPGLFGVILMGVAGLMGTHALLEGSTAWAAVSAPLGVIGAWMVLGAGEVVALDAYAAPLAAVLLVAGIVVHKGGASSWVAYTPAIATLGGAALIERLAGGGWPHAVTAGLVGVAAIALGGWRLLLAPLVLGTSLLVALTVHESLAVAASVDTWVWLAVAGAFLVGAGIAMERSATSPFEAGQRLVDGARRRFS